MAEHLIAPFATYDQAVRTAIEKFAEDAAERILDLVAQVAQTGAATDCLVSRNWSIAARAQSEV